jgi:hypothetical protein
MQDWTVLELALRVLVAVTEGNDPDPGDLNYLREVAPELIGVPADELACEVVSRLRSPANATTRAFAITPPIPEHLTAPGSGSGETHCFGRAFADFNVARSRASTV